MCSLQRSLIFGFLAFLCAVSTAYPYSVLSHEAIIDTLWKDSIEPTIRHKFPQVTSADLKTAHAFAYGGCIIQDVGYYPFGSHLFSDLTHYVRSGDFIQAMLHDAGDPDEYAFALGSLAHYVADNLGHPVAVNRAVPMIYPKTRRKYGDTVTYADDPTTHIETEFSFDVLQVARGRYAPESYHDFIGFDVAKPLLQRAFREIYGLELTDVFGSVDLSIGSYRKTVSSIIPELTKAAWAAKQDEIVRDVPGTTRDRFLYNLSRGEYEKTWGTQYEKPGIGARFLAFLFHFVPRIGPFKAAAFRVPTPEAERLFMQSFNDTVSRYRTLLVEERNDRLRLPNENFDVGTPPKLGTYKLADHAYAQLLHRLARHDFADASPELRRNILDFYDKSSVTLEKKTARDLRRIQPRSDSVTPR